MSEYNIIFENGNNKVQNIHTSDIIYEKHTFFIFTGDPVTEDPDDNGLLRSHSLILFLY
jgi:hypothetical protein